MSYSLSKRIEQGFRPSPTGRQHEKRFSLVIVKLNMCYVRFVIFLYIFDIFDICDILGPVQ